MPYTEENIRPALAADALAIAEIHVESWRTTYQGILPQTYLDALSVPAREECWAKTLNAPQPDMIALAAQDTGSRRVVGFLCGGRERTGQLGCDAELYAIYVLREFQGKGLGLLLVNRLGHELSTRGFGSLAVWVLAANPSRHFYERLGAEVLGEQGIELAGQSFTEVAYGWKRLQSFQSR